MDWLIEEKMQLRALCWIVEFLKHPYRSTSLHLLVCLCVCVVFSFFSFLWNLHRTRKQAVLSACRSMPPSQVLKPACGASQPNISFVRSFVRSFGHSIGWWRDSLISSHTCCDGHALLLQCWSKRTRSPAKGLPAPIWTVVNRKGRNHEELSCVWVYIRKKYANSRKRAVKSKSFSCTFLPWQEGLFPEVPQDFV